MLELARAEAGAMRIKSEALDIVYVEYCLGLVEFIHQDFSGIDQQGREHSGASKQANVCVNNTVPRLNRK